jgi:hypothetical protein
MRKLPANHFFKIIKPKKMTNKEIVSHAADISLVAAAPGAAQNTFCEAWPAAKSVLETLQGLIKNPIVKAAIGIIIGAGDAVSAKICG